MMNKKSSKLMVLLASLVVFVGLITSVVACSGGTATSANNTTAPAAPKSTVAPTWITPEVTDTEAIIPLDVVQTKYNVHFKVTLDEGTAYYMAYTYGGKTYVRADICPPCRSISFSLVKNTLVCDTCGTVFGAVDGKGLSGACLNYPKATVPFQTSDGKIVMEKADLLTAFENTLGPGLP